MTHYLSTCCFTPSDSQAVPSTSISSRKRANAIKQEGNGINYNMYKNDDSNETEEESNTDMSDQGTFS